MKYLWNFLISLGVKYIRLINLAPDAESISLIDANAQCPQESQGGSSQSQGEEPSGQRGQQGQGQQGGQRGQVSQPIVEQLGYLEASKCLRKKSRLTIHQLIMWN